jgi:hypothetical protein
MVRRHEPSLKPAGRAGHSPAGVVDAQMSQTRRAPIRRRVVMPRRRRADHRRSVSWPK